MSYPSDLTDVQWDLLEPVSNTPDKRVRKHADELRGVLEAILDIAQTGCAASITRTGSRAQRGVGCVRTATHQAR